MKFTLTPLLAGLLCVAWSGCAHDEVGDQASESALHDTHKRHGKHRFKDPAARAKRLQEKLGLSDEQTTQVEAVFADNTAREDRREALATILTPEQLAQYDEMKAKRGKRGRHGKRGKRGKHRRHKDPAARAAKLKEKLGLSDEQTAQAAAIFAADTERAEKREALRGILTPEQMTRYEEMKKKRGGRRGFRAPEKRAAWMQAELGLSDEQTAQVKDIFAADTGREEKREALKGILSPEDFAQYEEMKANRGRWRGKHGRRGFKAPEKRAAWMQAELGLSDEQTGKLVMAFKESKNREEKHEAIKRILTPEQLTQYEEMLAERKSRGHKHGNRSHR